MIYYLYAPTDDISKHDDYNKLGESSFKNFWSGMAWDRLRYYGDNQPEIMEKLIVKTSEGKELSLLEFVNEIKPLEIIQ